MAEKIKSWWRRLPLWLRLIFVIVTAGILTLSTMLPPLMIEPETPPIGDVASANLWVDSFLNDVDDWTEVGDSPWLDAEDHPNNYIWTDDGSVEQKNFTFQDLPSEASSIINVTLYARIDTQFENELLSISFNVWNGSTWSNCITFCSGGYGWKHEEVEGVTWTVDSVNNAQLKIMGSSYSSSYPNYVDAVYLRVYYETPPPYPSSSDEQCVQLNTTHWENRVNWTTSSGTLSHAWVCTNRTGVFQNESYTVLSGTVAWANITLPMNGTYVITWKQYCNNSDGYVGSTNWFNFAPKPKLMDSGHTTEYEWEECILYSYWWSSSGLQTGKIEHNATADGTFRNDTVNLGGVTEGWANTTVILPSAYQYVKYRFHMQDVDGDWSVSSWHEIYVWRKAAETYEQVFVPSQFGGRNVIYYNGARKALYYAFLNSSDGKYCVLGYDIKNETWYGAFEIGSAPKTDGHWIPSIGFFPNGTLFVTYGYYENITYRMTTYSADTESNLTKLLTNWSAEKTIVITPFACYPRPICVGNQVLILYRRGGSDDGWWEYLKWDNQTDSWTSYNLIEETEYSDETFHSLYLTVSIVQDIILITGYRHVGGTSFPVTNKDALFFYSDDYGQTWKSVNGTELSRPIAAKNVVVVENLVGGRAFLGYNNIPHITVKEYTSSKTYTPVTLARYNNSLGQNGVWETRNATKEDNTLIYGKGCALYDEYYEQASFWVSEPENETSYTLDFDRTVKYVCTGKKWYEFREVVEIRNGTSDNYYIFGRPVDNYAQTTFQIFGSQSDYGVIGKNTKGDNVLASESNVLWVCKYTASKTAWLSGIRIFVDFVSQFSDIKIALYNSSWNLLVTGKATTGSWVPSADFPDYYRWSNTVPFSNIVKVQSGTTYWIAFRIQSAGINIFYDTEGIEPPLPEIAGKKSYNWNDPWEDPLNSSELTMYNYRFSIIGEERKIASFGYSAPQVRFTDVSANPSPTGIETDTTFRSRWVDLNPISDGMDTCIFYWNVSGVMKQNGTFSFSANTKSGWANFTRTPPDLAGTSYVIQFYFRANNTEGDETTTIYGYVTVYDYTSLNVGWNNITAWSLDVGHTLLDVNVSLHIDNINFTVITFHYPNGTEISLIWIQTTDEYYVENSTMTVTSDTTIWIYCKEAGEWYHNYGS